MAGYKDPPKESQFKPGQSGNPDGSSKRQRMTSALIKVLEEKNGFELLSKVGYKAALEGDFKFWKEIFDRVDGKPRDAEPEAKADDDIKTLREFLAAADAETNPPKKRTRRPRKSVRGEDRDDGGL